MTAHSHAMRPVYIHIRHGRQGSTRAWMARLKAPSRADWHCVWTPPTDLYETAGGGCARIELAGMSPDDFRITYTDGVLTLAGTRREPPLPNIARSCHQKEIESGDFWYQLRIPWPVDAEAITADYKDGLLTVDLPRREA